jgi:hypothetical protein
VSGWLTDAEYEEEVRCAALGLEGPNAKSYRVLLPDADLWDNRDKFACGPNPLTRKFFCRTCHWSENAHPREDCPTGFLPGSPRKEEEE